MYKQKLTLDPKLAEICEASLMIYGEEPLQEATADKAANFKVLGCSKLSEQQMSAHKLVRAAASLAAGQKDVAVTELKCVSVEGNVLPAEFQMHYVFHVANYSNEAIASVPVTIYFNTPDHALVEQGTTTVKNIPAGHYQALEFTFPGVVAGQWKMSLEANKPRAFEESNYANNLLSRTFTYVNKAELIAESVSVVDDSPKFDAEGHQILYYDVPTTLEFVLSNVSAIDAQNVLVQVPAVFQDATGTYAAKLAETRMDVPAHTRRKLQLNITFTKPATAQIGLLLNNDKACDEVSYGNNETHEIFLITKYNPGTGPDPEPDGEQKLVYPFKTQYYTVGYKDDAPAYLANFSYGSHYANDFFASGDMNVYASGYGEIVGFDNFNGLGNVLAVKYTDVLNHLGRNIGPVIFRYCHLASVEKKSGWVKPGEKIAVEGASGNGAGNGKRVHLHLEVDRSIDNPLSTPTEGGKTDTTIDPLDILYRRADQLVKPDCAPEVGGSSVDAEGRAWYNVQKIEAIPVIS